SLATGSGAGRFRNNIIGNPGVASSGSSAGSAIRIDNNAILAIPVVVSITGNTIQGIGSVGTGQPGIYSTYGGIGGLGRTSAVTITGNTIRDVYNSNGVFIEQPGPGSTCANISGNTFSNVAGVSGDGTEIRLRNTTATAFNVTQTDPAVAADPKRLDTANGLTPADISVSGTVSFNQTPCVIP
ncbi:MAG: hypothetical protein ACXW2X_12560, partial [Thermoanaerobaculia bacterium]